MTDKLKMNREQVEEEYDADAWPRLISHDLAHDLLLQTAEVERLEGRLKQAEDAMCSLLCGVRRRRYLFSRGWVEMPVRSHNRFKSPYDGKMHVKKSAFSVECCRLRKEMSALLKVKMRPSKEDIARYLDDGAIATPKGPTR